MKIFLLFAVALSLVACGGTGGGYTVTEQYSDCPLCKAAKEGDLDRVEILLSGGMNPNSVSSSVNAFPEQTGKLNDSALRFAVVAGHADIVRALIDAGADVNNANENGSTSLSAASNFSSGEITKTLLDSGANPNTANIDGKTPLMFAVWNGNPKIAEALLDAGANPNAADKSGLTSLMVAAEDGHLKAAEVLLARGANPNIIDNEGWTALMLAVQKDRLKSIEVLLDAGANPNMVNKNGFTALMDAAYIGNAEIAKMLLDGGANPNTAATDGWTSINIAAEKGQAEVAKVLLDCGASPDKRNDEGINAWHWANRQPVMHAIFYRYLAEVKAGKVIKSCPHEKVAVATKLPKGENLAERVFENVWRSVVVVKSNGIQGSGVVVRPNVVATNCHVIDGGNIVVYKTEDRRALTDKSFSATVRKRDNARDFCLINVSGLWSIPANIRAYNSLKVGENVYALGAPQGLDLSLSSGIVSQLRQKGVKRFIQTDAAISPGSSGGGLFDSDGNLIGVLTSKYVGEDVEGIGFAIPADLALGL